MVDILLFNFSKAINSTAKPDDSSGFSVSVSLKDVTNMISPQFSLYGVELKKYNYAKYENRYYYITDYTYLNVFNQLEISCSLDSLATYREDILNSNAFVKYASTYYNANIVDTRLSTDGDVSIQKVYREMPYSYSPCYLISWNGEGGFSRGIVSYSELQTILLKQWDESQVETNSDAQFNNMYLGFKKWTNFLSTMEKTYLDLQYNALNITDYIKGVKYLPFTPETYSRQEVCIGKYHTGIYARVPNITEGSGAVQIPRKWSDFRNQSPFSKYVIHLPCFGAIEINANDFLGQSIISYSTIFDGFSGDLIYLIENGYAMAKTNVGVDIPIGSGESVGSVFSAIQSVLGTAGGVASSLVGVATNNVGTVFSSASGVANSIEQGIINVIQGNYGFVTGDAKGTIYKADNYITLIGIFTDTNVSPNNVNSVIGQPLFANVTLSSCRGGYVQCGAVKLKSQAPYDIIVEVINFLKGGVYLE
jgi:hypothetical protein